MRRYLLPLLCLFYLIVICSAFLPATAADRQPEVVTTFYAQPGESIDSFALRIAPDAQDVSYTLSSEVCGEFRKDGDVYALTLYTIRSLKRCSYKRLAGNTYVGLSYHTHVFIGIGNFHREGELLRNPAFSTADADHPGYLSSGRLVIFQRGDEKRRIGRY